MKRRALAALPALLAVPAHPAGPPAAVPPLGPVTDVVGPPTVPEGPAVIEGNLPAFYELLKQELTFPLAWGNSGIRDFGRWREAARARVEEALCQPPDRTPFAMELVDEVDAGAYRRRRILFNVTRHSRVRATMLVPHGSGPFPAALLLHDHGSKFDIGKEKLIQPWYDEARLASARAWAAKYFTGRFIGDELAARGYLVLAVDALGWATATAAAWATTASRRWRATSSTSADPWPACSPARMSGRRRCWRACGRWTGGGSRRSASRWAGTGPGRSPRCPGTSRPPCRSAG